MKDENEGGVGSVHEEADQEILIEDKFSDIVVVPPKEVVLLGTNKIMVMDTALNSKKSIIQEVGFITSKAYH